jgi:excisionase family DNA binding protein
MRQGKHPTISAVLSNGRRLYSAAEVCERVGISRPSLSRLCKAGRISFYRIGTRILFDELHVQTFLSTVEVKAKEVA